jgi:hypothetical protein
MNSPIKIVRNFWDLFLEVTCASLEMLAKIGKARIDARRK